MDILSRVVVCLADADVAVIAGLREKYGDRLLDFIDAWTPEEMRAYLKAWRLFLDLGGVRRG